MKELFLHSAKTIFAAKNRIYLYLFIVLVFISILTALANKWSSDQPIKKIIISGNTFIPNSEILASVDTTVLHSLRKDVSFLDVKNDVIKHPFIATSYVMHKNSSVIEIEVKERMPVAIVVKPNGKLCYTDKTGCLLPYRLSSRFSGLPLLRGLYNSKKSDSLALAGALNIISLAKKTNNAELNNLISEIKYNSFYKSYTIISSDMAYDIFLGKDNDLDYKLHLFCTFLNTEMKTLDVRKLDYIDLRWKDRVIVKNDES